mgnify:CR=1 FL=1
MQCCHGKEGRDWKEHHMTMSRRIATILYWMLLAGSVSAAVLASSKQYDSSSIGPQIWKGCIGSEANE